MSRTRSNDITLSRQWASRPDDERFVSLESLEEHLAARTQRCIEEPIDCKDIQVRALPDNQLGIETREGLSNFTNWSFGQLCATAGVPGAYLSKIPSELAGINLQYGLMNQAVREKTKLYIDKNGENTLRGATGPDYGRFLDLEIVQQIRRMNHDGRFQIPAASYATNNPKRATTLYAGDRDMFLFLVDPKNSITVDNETIFRGFYVQHSEVGKSVYDFCTFTYNYICDNRIVWGMGDVKSLRIKHSKNAPIRFGNEAEKALMQFADSSMIGLDRQVKAAKALNVARNDAGVTDWLKDRGFSGVVSGKILDSIKTEGYDAGSLWGMVQGVTAYARSIPHADVRTEVEKTAGKLLDRYAPVPVDVAA